MTGGRDVVVLGEFQVRGVVQLAQEVTDAVGGEHGGVLVGSAESGRAVGAPPVPSPRL